MQEIAILNIYFAFAVYLNSDFLSGKNVAPFMADALFLIYERDKLIIHEW